MTKEETREYNRKWRAAHPEKCAAYTKKYRAKNPELASERLRRWQQNNKDATAEYARKWRMENPEKAKAVAIKWKTANPEKSYAASNNWRLKNLDRVNANERKKCENNLSYKLGRRIRSRVRDALFSKGVIKSISTIKLLGCSIDSFKMYLESKFESGMTWDNYGSFWEIDHIMPCAIFDLTKPEHQFRCFHFSNQQPLTVRDNRRKHAKVLNPQLNLHL